MKTFSLIQGQRGQPESKEQVGLFELRTRMSHFFTFRPLFKRRKPIHAAEVPFPTQILSALKSFSMVETDPLPPPWPEEHRHWTGNSPVCSLMDACISSEDSRSNEFSLCFARSPARRGKSLHTINQPNNSCLCYTHIYYIDFYFGFVFPDSTTHESEWSAETAAAAPPPPPATRGNFGLDLII